MQPSREPPLITLTTDFGLADHYVGAMKGVLLSRCPDARLVDISHEVPAFSIRTAAYILDQAAPYFPAGTVHLVVIDPGVGTARKPLVVEALEQLFVAPDNGVLSVIVARDANAKAYEIANQNLWLPSPSSTFHGRDIFAPVAAALAKGSATAQDVGPIVPAIQLLSDLNPKQTARGLWQGSVLSIDRFGNVITNFGAHTFSQVANARFGVYAGDREITTFRATFGDAPQGLCFVYFGSSGYLEIGVNQGNAAAALDVKTGDPISLRL